MARKTKKKSRKLLYLFVAILAITFVAVFVLPSLEIYHMQIYLNDEPSDIGMKKIKTCYSFKSDFNCVYGKNHLITGAYVKAVTYEKNMEISDSGWEKPE